MINSQSHQKPTNFWFGFALGVLAAGSASYLLGTKKGRKSIEDFLKLSSNMEENFIDFAEIIQYFANRSDSSLNMNPPVLPSQKYYQKSNSVGSSLSSIMDKIKDASSSKKKGQKFVEKS